MCGEWQYVTTERNGGEWSDSSPCRIVRSKELLFIHWIEGWVGPSAVLNVREKSNNVAPVWNQADIQAAA
jgi:hypothetical protein